MACGPLQMQCFFRPEVIKEKFTHIRLRMYQNGGMFRFRLCGKVHPIILQDISTVIETASCLQVEDVVSTSDQHFGSANIILLPGRGHFMFDRWEPARLRAPDHKDWAIVKLGSRTRFSNIGVDTALYSGNFSEHITGEAIDDNNPEARISS